MSPGNRAGSVSEISHRHFFLCKNIDVCISTLGVCELALLVHKAVTVANNTNLYVSLEFIPVDRAEISHMNTPQNSSR